jgi:hypothetical protein
VQEVGLYLDVGWSFADTGSVQTPGHCSELVGATGTRADDEDARLVRAELTLHWSQTLIPHKPQATHDH